VRQFFDGPIVLSGAITSGAHIAAARAMGADLAYMGTRFIATEEANAQDAYKQMIVDSDASEIVYSPLFTGVHGNYLARSITAAGLDHKNLPTADKSSMNFGSNRVKPWKDIWGAGQGVGNIRDILPAAQVIERLGQEYRAASAQFAA
jgi:nitronate monooxygenase